MIAGIISLILFILGFVLFIYQIDKVYNNNEFNEPL